MAVPRRKIRLRQSGTIMVVASAILLVLSSLALIFSRSSIAEYKRVNSERYIDLARNAAESAISQAKIAIGGAAGKLGSGNVCSVLRCLGKGDAYLSRDELLMHTPRGEAYSVRDDSVFMSAERDRQASAFFVIQDLGKLTQGGKIRFLFRIVARGSAIAPSLQKENLPTIDVESVYSIPE